MKYPVRPRLPILRRTIPGCDSLKLAFSFGENVRGQRIIPNLGPIADDALNGGAELKSGGRTFTTTWERTKVGPAVWTQKVVGITNYIELGVSKDIIESNRYATFVYYGRRDNTTSAGHNGIFGNWEPNIPTYSDRVYGASITAADPATVTFFWGGYTAPYAVSTTSGPSGLDYHLYVFVKGHNRQELWIDGVQYASGTSGAILGLRGGTSNLMIGDTYAGVKGASRPPVITDPTNCNQLCAYWAYYTRDLSASEIISLYRDPWRTIRPKNFMIPEPFGALVVHPTKPPPVELTASDAATAEFEAPPPVAGVIMELAASTAAEAEFEIPDPSASHEMALAASSSAEIEFEVPDPELSLEVALAAQGPAEAEYEVPDPAGAIENALEADSAAEAEFEVPSPEMTQELALEASGSAEAEFEAPDPACGLENALSPSSPAEAEFEAPSPAVAHEVAVTASEAVEAEFEVPDPAFTYVAGDVALTAVDAATAEFEAAIAQISLSNTLTADGAIDVEFEVPAPAATLENELEAAGSAEMVLEVLAGEIGHELSLSAGVAEAVFEVLSPVGVHAEDISLSPSAAIDLELEAPSPSFVLYQAVCPGLVGKILLIVNKFGKSVIFHVPTSSSYDPTTGVTTASTIPVTRKITPPGRFQEVFKPRDLVQRGAIQFYVPACSLGFDPEPGMAVEVDGSKFRITRKTPIYSYSSIGAYDIDAVK